MNNKKKNQIGREWKSVAKLGRCLLASLFNWAVSTYREIPPSASTHTTTHISTAISTSATHVEGRKRIDDAKCVRPFIRVSYTTVKVPSQRCVGNFLVGNILLKQFHFRYNISEQVHFSCSFCIELVSCSVLLE